MSAKPVILGEMETSFLNTVNFMEILYNKDIPNYLTNPTDDCLYVIDMDFDHFGVTLVGKPEKTAAFRADLSKILEGIFENRPQWQQIQFS